MTKLERNSFGSILQANRGNRIFLGAMESAVGGPALLAALQCYIQFNSVFGGGVAHLAGSIAVRQDLFRDPMEPAGPLADRSAEVAAPIFFAAVDEFGDHTAHRATHRALAQATLRSAAAFFGAATDDLNALAESCGGRFARLVTEGYGIGCPAGEQTLFRAIGFHLGSELLADEEFRALDGALARRHPGLVEWLKKDGREVGGESANAYLWIAIHTTVEAEHLAAGFEAANRALRYYAGPAGPAKPREWVLRGFRDFADVQTKFMEYLSGAVDAAVSPMGRAVPAVVMNLKND